MGITINTKRIPVWAASLGVASLFALAASTIDPAPGHAQDMPQDGADDKAIPELQIPSTQENGATKPESQGQEPPCYTPPPPRGFQNLLFKYNADNPPSHLREGSPEIHIHWELSGDQGKAIDAGYIGPDHPDFDKLMEASAPKPCPVWI